VFIYNRKAMSPRPRRADAQKNLPEAIKETAWQQIAKGGAAALSLRAIARALGITAPAIYNYFPDRDALVTALIIDAYTSFGDWQLAASSYSSTDDLTDCLRAIGQAYRQWAITYPQRYQLIFGTPIPGYIAPFEQTFPSAARSLGILVKVVEALRTSGRLRINSFPQVMAGYEAAFEMWKNFGGEADILSLSVAVLIWARVHGLVSLEISGNIPPFGVQGDALYTYEIKSLIKEWITDDSK
jgi:AcrR family transcriptional regulator